MEDLKQIVAENITRLRTAANLTQAELGSMVNYSDKSISKWERGDAIPDVRVLLQLAQIFGVTVDDLLKPHDGQQPLRSSGQWHSRYSSTVITMVAIAGIWTLALLIFALLWMSGTIYWLVFVFAVPLTLVTWLILNSVWKAGRYNYFIVSGLILSITLAIYLALLPHTWWQLFLPAIPAELIAYLSFHIKRKRKT